MHSFYFLEMNPLSELLFTLQDFLSLSEELLPTLIAANWYISVS